MLTTLCPAQGSWNIGYIRVDTIGKQHIGQVVRIDFKSNSTWINTNGPRSIRLYTGITDTASIIMDSISYILVERRKIHVDNGSFNNQYLECLNCLDRTTIYNAKILNVDDVSIEFQFEIVKEVKDKPVEKQNKTIRVDKAKLDGVMIKI